MSSFLVIFDADAILDFEGVKSREERKAVWNAIDKLRQLGPRIVPPHAASLQNEAGLNELRPRRGSSPVRPIYRQWPHGYVILAFAIETNKADMDTAKKKARARFPRYDLDT